MKIRIKKMPSKEILEKFLMGMFEAPTVIFDQKKGKFIKIQMARLWSFGVAI